jgi:hypothetical protein
MTAFPAPGATLTALPTVATFATLFVVATLDAAFSGFRASAGRDGLVHHRRQDLVGTARGLMVFGGALVPLPALVMSSIHGGTATVSDWVAAAGAMLAVYVPYALVVLGALVAFAVLPWRVGYLATAVLLGPLTFARPLVALAGAVAAWTAVESFPVRLGVVGAVVIVLGIEPAVGRRWYQPSIP